MFKKYALIAIPVRNGILGSVLGMALIIGLFYIGKHPLMIPVIMDFRIILFAVLMIFTLKEYRDFHRNGVLSFVEAMIMCFIFTASFALVAFAILWVFGLLQPQFVAQYIAERTELLLLYPKEEIAKISQGSYDYALNAVKNYRASDLALIYVSQCFTLSIFVSIIISVILRRQQPKT